MNVSWLIESDTYRRQSCSRNFSYSQRLQDKYKRQVEALFRLQDKDKRQAKALFKFNIASDRIKRSTRHLSSEELLAIFQEITSV